MVDRLRSHGTCICMRAMHNDPLRCMIMKLIMSSSQLAPIRNCSWRAATRASSCRALKKRLIAENTFSGDFSHGLQNSVLPVHHDQLK